MTYTIEEKDDYYCGEEEGPCGKRYYIYNNGDFITDYKRREDAEKKISELEEYDKNPITEDLLLAKKEAVEALLPEGFELDTDVLLHPPGHAETQRWGVVIFSKNGSSRVTKDDALKVIQVLHKLTGKTWEIDNISDFVIHYRPGISFHEQKQLLDEYFEEQKKEEQEDYHCQLCNASMSYDQYWYGECPSCGASAYERAKEKSPQKQKTLFELEDGDIKKLNKLKEKFDLEEEDRKKRIEFIKKHAPMKYKLAVATGKIKEMPYDELIKEHEELVEVMEKGTQAEKQRILEEQKEELNQYKKEEKEMNDYWKVGGMPGEDPFAGLTGISLGYERYRGSDVVRLRFVDGRQAVFAPHQLFPGKKDEFNLVYEENEKQDICTCKRPIPAYADREDTDCIMCGKKIWKKK